MIGKLHGDDVSSNATPTARTTRLAGVLSVADWPGLTLGLAAVALLVYVAWPVLTFWFSEYSHVDSYYSHGPAMPFLIALMLWYKRDSLRAARIRPCYWALAVLVPSLLLLVFASRVFPSSLSSIALLFVVWSSVWFAAGTDFVRRALFPLAFLSTMAPLPHVVLTDATQSLQQLSTTLANHLLNALSFQTTLDGNVIKMENYSMAVDVPCSGFKMLLSMATFAAAFAYLIDIALWKRIVFFLISLPLSLIINSVRIAMIGIVGECIGVDAAHVFHDWSGILTLLLGFGAFLLIAKGMGCRTFAGWRLF